VPVCASCGGESPEGFAYCPRCGAALLGGPIGREERKTVTVLFCDLVGFTAASEAVDPEDVRARLRPYHELLRERIEAFGGTVEKFVGDAVMAVFGAPVAHEDDAERAVRSALDILERLEQSNEASPELSLSVRVGINSGEALVALDVRPEQGEGFVTGDVVNTASRIQSAAPVDGIAVGQLTYQATAPVFEWRELPAAELKGKAEPVSLWQPLSARARLGADVIRALATPLVGRELDLLQLRTAFEKAVRDPSVQLVTIVGEPGVGKSRLVAELGAHVDGLRQLVRWRQGRCLPYGEGIAFWALGEIVKAQAGIYESDSPDEAAHKLEQSLPDVDEAPWLKARLLPLLGVESSAAASRDESFTAWRRFLEAIAERAPTVLVFEDLHWADESLLDFLGYVADWAHGVPLLVVSTARPELYERRATWGAGLRNATTVNLAPLSEAETALLVSSLLERSVLPAETQRTILERAGGNPLYAEEFVRMLRDRDLLDERGELRPGSEVPSPESLQALIAARLDTLSSESKGLLQDAAVVGKVFWAGAVAAIGEREPAVVERVLHELARKELVRPARQSSMEGDRELGFWHVLVRDVAYGQIPRSQRAAKHVAAAEWIEARAGERLEDLADVLAYHTGEAIELARATGDFELADRIAPQARRYALLAGGRALGLDTLRALELLERAVALTPEDDVDYPYAVLRYGSAALQAGRSADATAAAERATAVCRARGDPLSLGAALTFQALALPGLPLPEHDPIFAAIELLEAAPPGRELVDAHTQLAGRHLVLAEHEACRAASECALSLAESLELPVPARALGFHGAALINLGDPTTGLAELEQARHLLATAGFGRDAAVAYHNYGVNRWVIEGLPASLDTLEEAQHFASERGLLGMAASSLATRMERLVDAGYLDETLRQATEARAAVDSGVMAVQSCVEYHAAVARATLELGEMGAAREAATAARDRAYTAGAGAPTIFLAIAAGPAATLAIADGNRDTARAILDQLLAVKDAANISEEYFGRLPSYVRCALAAGDVTLAERLSDGVNAVGLPLCDHSVIAAQALTTEARGNPCAAAELFADAAGRWNGFGARLEQAYALHGQGRCLAALDGTAAEQPLRAARALFAEMGARPRVEECDVLLASVIAEGA
jgi:class 3 adenylate cyclase/tetratricopeptide (TPR) repeat protein